jgi:hypothetical protein
MNVNNLTNVYNNNPTLQGSYTLQQYLDLFGGTPPTSTIPPTDPNAPTTPITPDQGIINANINQFQGGGDGGGITTIGSNRINSNNPTFRDPLNDLIESKLSVEDREKYSDNMYNIQETKTGFIDGVKNTATDLLDLYKTYSPMGFIGRKIEQAQKSKVERERVAAEKARKEVEREREAQAAIAAAEKQRAEQYGATNYGRGSDGQQSYSNMGTQGFGVNATTGGPVSNKTGKGRTDYFNGGIAGFKNGGRINFRGGGMDMGNASNQAQSASMGSSKSSTNQGPAGGASSGGNYGGNRNPKQTYGGGGGRPKTNIITKSGKDLAALFNVPVQGIQALFGNPFNRKGGFLTKAGLTPGQIENLEKDANEIGGLKGKITNTTYGSPNNMFGFHKNMDLTDFANSATFGQGNFTKDPTTGKISLDGGNYDFKQDQFGKVGNFINDGGVSGFVNRNVVEPISKFGANLYEDQVNNSNINYLASGGRVGAKDGGSMTQIVKDRLMDKNPAMWGLGYEGLASLQDLIMSIPFNQGGIVNIRRR